MNVARARRLVPSVMGAVLLGTGLALAFPAPRLTLLNAALRVDYPWTAAAGGAAAAVGAALLAMAAGRRWARVALGLPALGLALLALSAGAYRLEAGDEGLAAREWMGGTLIRWTAVSRVESGPTKVVVWGADEAQIRIDTSRFRPEQRATLERAIARFVRQASASR